MGVGFRIQLLGGLRLWQGDKVIDRLPTQKAGLILAYLALECGRAVGREQLIDLLWPELDLQSGRNNLSTQLSLLRRVLEPAPLQAGAILQADRQQIRLNPEGIQTDLQELAACCRRAERAADTETRLQAWGEAIGLAQGELLPGYVEEWAVQARMHYAEQTAQILRQRSDLLIAQGRFEEATTDAARALIIDGYDEEASRLQMRALACLGRPAAALQVYIRLEQELENGMGIQPTQETQALKERIRQEPEAFLLPPAGNAPADGTAVGAAQVPAASATLADAEARPLADEAVLHRSHLPQALTRFFGRKQEQQDLAALLASPSDRLVTLIGAGGVGKTRLALEVGRQVASRYRSRVWFVALAEVSSYSMIPMVLQHVLGAPSVSGNALEGVVAFLAEAPSLLIFDNMEHLLPNAGSLVRHLLENVPNLTCLVTSQQTLGLEGEQEYLVPPLEVPEEARAHPFSADRTEVSAAQVARAGESAGMMLYVDRAQKAKADFTLTVHNVEAVSALCRRLEGMPLAIEMAAAWIKTLPPARMLTNLEKQLAVLVSRRRDLPPRQRSLRAACEWSYHLLTPEHRHAFLGLSVFRGWTLEAAEAVIGPRALYDVAELQARSLVTEASLRPNAASASERDETEETRYYLLEPLREFALEKLGEQEEAALPARRHAFYFLEMALASRATWDGVDQGASFGRLERDHDNLLSALTWFETHTAGVEGVRMVIALQRFWRTRGYLSEALLRLETALAYPCTPEMPLEQAQLLNSLGLVNWTLGNYSAAVAYFTQALDTFRGLANLHGMAAALGNLGNIAEETGDTARAHAIQTESLALYERQGDYFGMARCLISLSNIALKQSDFDTAWNLKAQSAAICREHENPEGLCAALVGMAYVGVHQGELAKARHCLREGLPLAWQLQDYQRVAYGLDAAALITVTAENFVHSARLCGAIKALRLQKQMPLPPHELQALEERIDRLREKLGSAVCRTLMEEGESYSPQQALEAALAA